MKTLLQAMQSRQPTKAEAQGHRMGSYTAKRNLRWTLQGRPDLTGPVEVTHVEQATIRVGRCGDVTLRINRPTISSSHAEIFVRNGDLWLRDLKSTNGTYVNGTPVTDETQLERGDLVQFADVAFRVGCVEDSFDLNNKTVATSTCDEALSLVQFDRLMQNRSVIPHFQPIVALPDLKVVGYEVLGRSRHYGLESPKDMFLAASQLNQEGELSELLRCVGTREGESIDGNPRLFLNTHPVELVTCGLLDSLGQLRELHPGQKITLEVHEAAVTDVTMMDKLRKRLSELDMGLAYDDFGAGETRLLQLANVCPDCVKFDMHMIRDIHLASPRQRQLLSTLVTMVRDFGSAALAEGVESDWEHDVCCELGFEFGQGYFYGKPQPAEHLNGQSRSLSLF
ncbi:MAG: EAL domain-containing protein [Planctomycetaceae bacterium]|nr:EAL domain-containing protein [Planctomycetales bacterium]MCB9921940.1 EAL domain-containing protein [Planctomycetaceae bacterium]